MNILGISSNYHDSSAALVVNGKVVASGAEERFSREKHDPSYPFFAINFCLERANINTDQIDLVAYHEDPINKFSRNLMSTLVNWPHSRATFVHAMKEVITSGFWIRHEIAKKLNISPRKIVYIPHHLSHAAHTYLTSGFENAAILTLDAVGEWTSTGIFYGDRNNKKECIKPVKLVAFPHSLGLVYSAFTGFLGFKVNSGESSTMALAAFGKPTYADEVRKIIYPVAGGTFETDLSYFDFSQIDGLPLTKKFTDVFGQPRPYKNKLSFSCFPSEATNTQFTQDEVRYANIAASIQLVLEEIVLHLVKLTKDITKSDNLCLAGGVVLNCVSNSKILSSKIFKNVYCPPDPGDGGGAMGAALYLASKKNEVIDHKSFSPFLGQSHNTDQFELMLKDLDPSNWHTFSRLPLKPLKKENIKVSKFSNQDELVEKTADLLANKKIVGWAQGNFENGPRALGARSILIDPSDAELAQRLSKVVKLRAPFRPYACSLTSTAANTALEFPTEHGAPQLAKWMLCALKVKEPFQQKLKGAIHIDKTTRAQIVEPSEQPLYHKLLNAYEKRTGLGALLNTSFNESGFPIVNTPTEAMLMFSRTALDALVIENLLIERVY